MLYLPNPELTTSALVLDEKLLKSIKGEPARYSKILDDEARPKSDAERDAVAMWSDHRPALDAVGLAYAIEWGRRGNDADDLIVWYQQAFKEHRPTVATKLHTIMGNGEDSPPTAVAFRGDFPDFDYADSVARLIRRDASYYGPVLEALAAA